MKRLLLISLLPLAALADPDLDPLVGEWTFSDDGCMEARMVFDFEGNYGLNVAEEGRWKPLERGQWRREGDLIVTETDGRSERFDIELESRDRIVLLSRDVKIDREAGIGALDLRRCPSY